MKKRFPSAVLALVFSALVTSGNAQEGYIRFVDSLSYYLSNRASFIEVEDLVFSNLANLNVRRLVDEADENYFFQRGYDLNQDNVLNEKDGFELIDNEKFSPWGYYLELYPCKGNQSIYIEARGIDHNKKVYQIQKMLRLREVKIVSPWCKSNLKFQLPPGDTSITIQARELIRNNVYERCVGQAYDDTIGLEALDKFSIEPWCLFSPKDPHSNKSSITLNCKEHSRTLLTVFVWKDSLPVGSCQAWVEIIDTSGSCRQNPATIKFRDSLEYHLFQAFTGFKPLIPAKQLLKSQQAPKTTSLKIRRSIRPSEIKQWVQLGFDRNADGSLSNLDGYDWNLDGDIQDDGEHFQTKGSFILSPYLDSIPLVCADFGDSLFFEVSAFFPDGSSYKESRRLCLSTLPPYFTTYQHSYSSFIKLKPGSEANGYSNNGIGEIKVADLVKSPFYSCLDTGDKADPWGRSALTRISLGRTRQAPDSTRKVLFHECCENRSPYLLIKIHVWRGNSPNPIAEHFAFAEIRDTLNACFTFGCLGEPPSIGTIVTGSINTSQGQQLKTYQVRVINQQYDPFVYVNESGLFSHYVRFRNDFDHTYYIPEKNDDHSNGVTTFDLLQIQRHILGKQVFSTPYQYIAADINQSGSISTLDLIQLRKVILNLDTKFPNNTSWRFIDAAHVFNQPEEALTKYWPNRVLIKIPATSRRIDFIAVKIGDLNGSAVLK